jgi:hypothetical protein
VIWEHSPVAANFLSGKFPAQNPSTDSTAPFPQQFIKNRNAPGKPQGNPPCIRSGLHHNNRAMNTKHFTLLLGAALLVMSCATTRYQPSTVFQNSAVTPVPKPSIPPSQIETITRAAAEPIKPFDGDDWRELFDEKSLNGWRVTDFGEGGNVIVTNGLLVFNHGNPFVGVNLVSNLPTINYEVAFDAMRVAGDDFFCGLTFPVGESFCSLIVGGWGGGLVGLSNIDGADASENETTTYVSFETGRWYRIRLRVTEQKIEAWIEQKKVVNFSTTGRKLSVRFGEIMRSQPFGLASWETSSAFREIKIREISKPDSPANEN